MRIEDGITTMIFLFVYLLDKISLFIWEKNTFEIYILPKGTSNCKEEIKDKLLQLFEFNFVSLKPFFSLKIACGPTSKLIFPN